MKQALTGLFAASIAVPCAAKPSERYPRLMMHGESYENSCHPVDVDKLRKALLMSKVRSAEQLWHAVNVLLCSRDNGADVVYITKMFPSRIRRRAEGTGADPIIGTVQRSRAVVDEVIAKGQAWDATLRNEGKTVILQYFKDEVCVHGVDFMFVNRRWMISEIGQACD